jgi:hypothetical protein
MTFRHDASDLGMLERQQCTFLQRSTLHIAGRLCSENHLKGYMYRSVRVLAKAHASHVCTAASALHPYCPHALIMTSWAYHIMEQCM